MDGISSAEGNATGMQKPMTLYDYAAKFGTEKELLDHALPHLGVKEDSSPEVVTFIPEQTLTKAIADMPGRAEATHLNPMEQGVVNHFFVKLKAELANGPAQAPSSSTSPAAVADEAPKKKISDVLDQTDDSTFPELTASERQKYRQNHVALTGGVPSLAVKPSAEQLGALKAKMDSGKAPYCDFALFTPHGKRVQKLLKFTAQVWVNNQLQQRVLTGPSDFRCWTECWRVFRAAMISLDAATPQVLDDYYGGIEQLTTIFPKHWGLIYMADELIRSEVWGDMREQIEDEGQLVEKGLWNKIIANSTYGKSDPERTHWWYLHVTAPASTGQGRAMVSDIEGTTLLPSSDGLFGTASRGGTSTAASSNSQTGTAPRQRRRVRQYSRAANHASGKSGASNYDQTTSGKKGYGGKGGGHDKGGEAHNGKNSGGKGSSKGGKGKKGPGKASTF